MRCAWQTLELGSVCEVFDGPHATPKKTSAGPVFLGISSLSGGRIDLGESEHLSEKDFVRWTRRVTPSPGDVVFSYETRLGEAALIPEGLKCCLGRRMGLLRPKDGKADSRFLLYAYLAPEFQETLRSRTVYGSTVERISILEMPKFPITLPPLREQRAIAGVLGALDDKIELNRRMNETLETLAQAKFGRLKDEGGGMKTAPLPEVIEVNPPRPLRKGEIAPYLDMANMPTRSARALEVYDREFGSGMRFMDGDTLVARITPCLENGKTCFVDFLGPGKVGWGSTEYIVLRPKPPLPPEYAYFLARTEEFRAFAISNMTGTSGRQRFPADCLDHFQVEVPSVELAERFGQFARAVFVKMKANDEESRTLAALRDALLPKLLSGAVRVKAA
jgi:type I restriction enzyme S subunit